MLTVVYMSTIYRFTGTIGATLTTGKGRRTDCPLKIVLREGDDTEEIGTCNAIVRKTVIFTSSTNELFVYFTRGITSRGRKNNIMIQYEGEN